MKTKEEVEEKVNALKDSNTFLKQQWEKEKNVGFNADIKEMDWLDKRYKQNEAEIITLEWVLGYYL